MLDYTVSAFQKIADDFKRFITVFDIGVQIFYIAYLIYAIFAPAGILIVNVVLLVFALAYLVFSLFGKKNAEKQDVRVVKRAYKWFKIAIKAFTLGIMIYGIYAATTHVTTLSVALCALSIVGWTLQVFFEVVLYFIVSRIDFITEAFRADFEGVHKAADKIGNVIKRVRGEEVEEKRDETPSRNRKLLDKLVSERHEERKRKKREERMQRREARKRLFSRKKKTEEHSDVALLSSPKDE